MEENRASSDNNSKPKFNKKLLAVFLVLFLLILAFIAAYFYLRYQNTKDLLQNPNQASLEATKKLIDQVGKLIELPAGETPTLATVSDKTKLQDQPFFANAQNGDKVLIYVKAKKAILYRPSINKIIEVAPLSIAQPTAEPVQSATASATTTVTPTVIQKEATPTPTP